MALVVGSGITIETGISILSENTPYVSTGLQVYLDAGNPASYPGSGTTWTSLVNGYTGSMGTGVGYSSGSGGVITFNGATTAFVSLVNSSFAALTNNFSVEYWYQCTNNRPEMMANGAGSNGFVFGYFTTNPTNWKVTKYGIIDLYIGSIPQNTAWHQAVLTYSSTTGTRVYIDGVLSGSIANNTNLAVGSSTFAIGKGESTSFMHTGSMGIVRWYNTVLSATDVTQNFNADRARYGI